MSASKRPASDSFGSSQMVVKRQKSNIDLANGKAVAALGGNSGNGALIQAVGISIGLLHTRKSCAERTAKRRPADGGWRVGATHEWVTGADYGTHW